MIDILYDYEKATGSRINKEKTRYKYLGKWEGRKDKICDFMLCEGPMDVLGISFGNGEGDALCNWKKKMTAVEKKSGIMEDKKTLRFRESVGCKGRCIAKAATFGLRLSDATEV